MNEATTAPPRHLGWFIVIGVIAIGAIAFGVQLLNAADNDAASEYVVVVPAGTDARLQAGETVELMPPELVLQTNDTLVIRNDDKQAAEVGPFRVNAGTEFRHTFTEPGRFEGVCALNPSGRVVITVT